MTDGRGLGLSSLAAVAGAVVVAAIGCWRLPRVLPEQLDGALQRFCPKSTLCFFRYGC